MTKRFIEPHFTQPTNRLVKPLTCINRKDKTQAQVLHTPNGAAYWLPESINIALQVLYIEKARRAWRRRARVLGTGVNIGEFGFEIGG